MLGGSTKIVVETSITRVIEDKNVTDTIQEAIIEAILDSRDIPLNITDRMLNGPVQNFNKMHRYAKEEYTYGLPRSNSAADISVNADASASLDAVLGTSSYTLDYAEIGKLNVEHMARERLQTEYNYSEATNEIGVLSGQKGETVYLDNITPLVSEQFIETSGEEVHSNLAIPASSGRTEEREFDDTRPHSPIASVGDDEEGAVINICWWTTEEETTTTTNDAGEEVTEVTEYRQRHNESFKLDMGDYNIFYTYYQIRYLVDGSSGHTYFSYHIGSGEHPDLDTALLGTEDDLSEYWPFVTFIADSQNMVREAVHGTEGYKTSVKLLDILGMDYQNIGEKIQENEEGVEDVEQAFMMMGVPANTQNQTEIQYIFEFFNQVIEANGGTESGSGTMFFDDKSFGLTLRYNNIKKGTEWGKKTEVGEYTQETVTIYWTEEVSYYKLKDGEPMSTVPKVRLVYGEGFQTVNQNQFELVTTTKDRSKNYFLYTYQVDEDHYITIETDGLVLRYQIAGQRDSGNGFINMDHGVNADVNDDRLLIPINKGIGNSLNYRRREELYLRSLHFVFNSKVKVKTKWYQTGLFKFVLTVAAIVITVMSAGSAYATLAAAAAIGSAAFAWALIQMIVISLAFKEGFSLVAEELGAEWAMALAVVAAMYGGTQALRHGSVDGAPFASEMLQLASGLSNAVSKNIAEDMGELRDEAAELQSELESSIEDFSEANALLETNSTINPMVFVVGEAPNQFYERTIHSGNMGSVVFDALHGFVDMKLKLPTINDTTRETFYE